MQHIPKWYKKMEIKKSINFYANRIYIILVNAKIKNPNIGNLMYKF